MTLEQELNDEQETPNPDPVETPRYEKYYFIFGAMLAFAFCCLLAKTTGFFETSNPLYFVNSAGCYSMGHVPAHYESHFDSYQDLLNSTPTITKVENAYTIYQCANNDLVKIHEK